MSLSAAQFNALVDALTVVLPLNSPADVQLKHYFREHPKLGLRDRGLIAETAFAVLRHRRLIEHIVPDGSPRRMALVGLTRFLGMSARELTPILRKSEDTWLTGTKGKNYAGLSLGIQSELPDWVIARLQPTMNDEAIIELGRSMMNPASLDLRVNTFKAKREQVIRLLQQQGIACAATPHSPIGIRLEQKIALNKHAAFLEGFVEVQDEGSQLLGILLEAKRGEMVVDFCAGAGGKSLLIGAMMASTGRVYAFDVSERRLANLGARLKRSGLSNITPQRIANENDARIKRLAGKIDRVLVDAPCTGLGTLRRNPDLKFRQTETGLAELNVKQAAILASAARLVAPGGKLVYATCSFLREENEGIIEAFLQSHEEFTLVPAAAALARQKINLDGMTPYFRLSPLEHGTDGFFAAVMERRKK
ncbi:MAG: RsmB/NOP family class I SAM-dependent RNA methyltransferase [Betaproteobacteria bacterium]|nr:RsmB/NOP family class I SAM-dependent RNA methyltransferase [Betaproteobacteria bacterium]